MLSRDISTDISDLEQELRRGDNGLLVRSDVSSDWSPGHSWGHSPSLPVSLVTV